MERRILDRGSASVSPGAPLPRRAHHPRPTTSSGQCDAAGVACRDEQVGQRGGGQRSGEQVSLVIERLIIEKTRLERAYAQEALVEASELRTLGALTDGLIGREPTGPLILAMPAPGPIARRFGDTLPAGGRSSGLAIRVDKGRTVNSPVAGTVEYSGALNGWGVVLILRAQGAYHVVLAGLDQVSVGPGQSVAAGDPIGKMGDRVSSDPELYLEVRKEGAPVDPARWLKQGSP